MDWFCPKIFHQLDQVTSVGIGTHYPLHATEEARGAIAAVEDLYEMEKKKVENFMESSVEDKMDKVQFVAGMALAHTTKHFKENHAHWHHHGEHQGEHQHYHHHGEHQGEHQHKPCPFKKAVDAAKALHATDEARKAIAAVENLYELEKKKVDGMASAARSALFV